MATEKPGAAAIAHFPCPTCDRPATSKCVTSSGKDAAVHVQRWRLGEGWVARQGEVDLSAERFNESAESLKIAQLTIADLNVSLQSSATSLTQTLATLQQRDADLAAARARIAELETPPTVPVEPPVEPPTTDPWPKTWKLDRDIDLSKPGKFTMETGKAGNNDGHDRPANVKFGVGPNGKSMRIDYTRGTDGIPYVGDALLRAETVKVPFALYLEFQYDKPIPSGMWPAPWWGRPGTGGNGRGELDPLETFMAHALSTRDRFTIHRTGTGADGYKGANHGKGGKTLPLVPAGTPVPLLFEMLEDRASVTMLGKTTTITPAELDKLAGAGSWDSLSDYWYGRATLQVGAEGGQIPTGLDKWGFEIHRWAYLKPA